MLIIFDLDDTLYSASFAFESTLNDLNLTFKESIETLYQTYMFYSHEAFCAVQKEQMDLQTSYRHRFNRFFQTYGYQFSLKELDAIQQNYAMYQSKIDYFPNMESLLMDLKTKQHQLAILTNGPIKGQTTKLKALNIKQYIPLEHCFISEKMGYAKPDTKAFETVLKAFNKRPTETVMIGDTYSHDIKPANELGLKTIWFNHRNHQIDVANKQSIVKDVATLFKKLGE